MNLNAPFNLYNEEYQQSYHCRSFGAFLESMIKHIIPAVLFVNEFDIKDILEITNSLNEKSDFLFLKTAKREIRILDICFGLGSNAFLALKYFNNVEIYSPEKDFILDKLKHIWKNQIYIKNTSFIIEQLIKESKFTSNNSTLYYLHGDARNFYFPNNFFDVVFQDPFSQKTNFELWDKAYFKNLYSKTKNKCIITSYAKSKGIIKNAEYAGFEALKYKHGIFLFKN